MTCITLIKGMIFINLTARLKEVKARVRLVFLWTEAQSLLIHYTVGSLQPLSPVYSPSHMLVSEIEGALNGMNLVVSYFCE